jgi:hypothetical protein
MLAHLVTLAKHIHQSLCLGYDMNHCSYCIYHGPSLHVAYSCCGPHYPKDMSAEPLRVGCEYNPPLDLNVYSNKVTPRRCELK